MAKYRNTKEDYIKAVSESFSIAEVCRKLGILPRGGNFGTVKGNIHKYDLDISHFTGQGWNKENFSSDPVARKPLKDKLIRERGHQCESCKNAEWMDKPITLELEHIDGNNRNNVDSNLLLLCPNCHALTPTWRRSKNSLTREFSFSETCPECSGKKRAASKRCNNCRNKARIANKLAADIAIPRPKRKKLCVCGTEILLRSMSCSPCKSKKQRRIDWPDATDLISMIKKSNYSQVSRDLGVSDNALRNHIRRNGFNLKTLEPLELQD